MVKYIEQALAMMREEKLIPAMKIVRSKINRVAEGRVGPSHRNVEITKCRNN